MKGWLDTYEDGGQFDGLTNKGFNYNGAWGGPAQDGKTFYNDYINSPKYKERLVLQNYTNPEKVVNERTKHLSKTKLNVLPNTGQFTEKNTGSFYYPETNTVDYDPFDLTLYPGSTAEDIKVHEFSHAVNALKPENKNNLTLNKKEVNEINKRNKIKESHEKNAWEAKADMDVLRYHLKKDNIYNTGNQDFTDELLKKSKRKYKNNQTIKRFFDRFSDKDAVYLMNSIAENSADENNVIAQNGTSMPGSVGFTYARTGAPSNGKHAKKTMASAKGGLQIIDDDMGQWAHPGKITRINSNNITMKGVDYPVLGVSDTGDKKLMKPGKNYNFKGSKVTEYPLAQNGGSWLDSLSSRINPKNWGVKDYSDKTTFALAYKTAKKSGEDEFMWNNKRYSTSYAGTPRQEVGSYGIKGKPVPIKDLDYPSQVNFYPKLGNYLPGHIAVSGPGNDVSVDFGPKGNNYSGLNKVTRKGEHAYNVYGNDEDKIYDKLNSLPLVPEPGLYDDRKGLKGWNLLTNNCADNVCDALDIPRSRGIETPPNTLKKIKERYPTLDITGRTEQDYLSLAEKPLENIDSLINAAKSPDFIKSGTSKEIVKSIQSELIKSGINLHKSLSEFNNNPDGILGPETLKAIKEYKNKTIKKSKNGGELTKLDQLTNFTNYNKPQPGGWLDNL